MLMFGKILIMRKLVFFLLTILPFASFAQTELISGIGTGLFFFGGNSAVRNSLLIVDYENGRSYINNPYGKIPGFSFNISEDIHHCSGKNFLFGMNLSYNYLRSATNLTQADNRGQNVGINQSNAFLKVYDISLMPFVGKRFKTSNLDIDISAGAEVAFPFYAEDKATVITHAGYEIEVARKRNMHVTDFRPTLKVNTYYNNVGIFASYSHGLSNYTAGMDGANMEVYSRLVRFGVNYRFRKS